MRRPVIVKERGKLDPYDAPLTFVVVCGGIFDQTVPNAATTARMGFCHGFEQIGIPYLLLSAFELARRLPDIPNAVCWISGSDYAYLNARNLQALRRHRHLVWVGAWFPNEADFYSEHGLQNHSWPEELNRKILSSEPGILFTISPESSLEYYSLWVKHGARLVSLPLACDTSVYNRDVPLRPQFAGVEIAFVGGYWPYKARQFDRYLRPYEDQLKVYGYSRWPYAGYGGRISMAEEASLYRQARLSPTINEPHVEVMGIDPNERVFKVLGCGGMTITDVVPAYREWFSDGELAVPYSVEEYHSAVLRALNDEGFNRRHRETGYRAVVERHTYAHRARTILECLNINPRQSEEYSCERVLS